MWYLVGQFVQIAKIQGPLWSSAKGDLDRYGCKPNENIDRQPFGTDIDSLSK
jgi:hypothetical protein